MTGSQFLWWAVFIRTGLPPRVAKRMLTAREAQELRAYYQRFPFDDESLQVVHAQQSALYVNAHLKDGADPVTADDFLPFRPRADADPDAEFDATMQAFFRSL